MIRSLVLRQFRHHRLLMACVAVGCGAFAVLVIQIAAAVEASAGLAALLEMLPPMMRNLVESQASIISFPAFVAFGFQHPAVLVTAIALVILVATTPAGDRDSGVLDLILARPISRHQYLVSTLLTLALVILALTLVLIAGVVAGLALVQEPDELPWTRYLPCAVGMTTLLLAIGGFTLLVAAGARRRGNAIALVTAVLVTLFLVETFADLWTPLRNLRWLSPFHYYKPMPAAVLRELPLRDPVVLLVVFALSAGAAFARFQRRDV